MIPGERPFAPPDDATVRMLFERTLSATAIISADIDGRCRYASPGTLALFGRPPSTLYGMPLALLVHPADHAAALDAVFDAAAGGGPTVPLRVRHADGRWMRAHLTVQVRRDRSGALEGYDGCIVVPATVPLRDGDGLASAELFIEQLEQAMVRHRRRGEPYSMIRIGVRAPSPRLITIAGRRLGRVVRRWDTVQAVPPSAFHVLCNAIEPGDVARLARRALDRIAAAHSGTGTGAASGAGIEVVAGIAHGRSGLDPDDLVAAATDAARVALLNGPGSVVEAAG